MAPVSEPPLWISRSCDSIPKPIYMYIQRHFCGPFSPSSTSRSKVYSLHQVHIGTGRGGRLPTVSQHVLSRDHDWDTSFHRCNQVLSDVSSVRLPCCRSAWNIPHTESADSPSPQAPAKHGGGGHLGRKDTRRVPSLQEHSRSDFHRKITPKTPGNIGVHRSSS